MNAGLGQAGAESRVGFATTAWSLVARAAHGSDDEREQAVAELARLYWPPIYAFLRRRGHQPADAQDLTQAFFLHVLDHDLLRRCEPGRGKFRSFLLGVLDNFMANDARARHALKRGGDRVGSFDPTVIESILADSGDDPARAFDRHWAIAVLSRALDRVLAELGEAERAVLRLHLRPDGRPPRYRECAAQLNMSEAAFTSALHRARSRLRHCVLEEVGEDAADLRAALRGGR